MSKWFSIARDFDARSSERTETTSTMAEAPAPAPAVSAPAPVNSVNSVNWGGRDLNEEAAPYGVSVGGHWRTWCGRLVHPSKWADLAENRAPYAGGDQFRLPLNTEDAGGAHGAA